jgi:hypothetical protein
MDQKKKRGKPLKYGEPMENLTLRIPKSRKQEILEVVRKMLSKWAIK